MGDRIEMDNESYSTIDSGSRIPWQGKFVLESHDARSATATGENNSPEPPGRSDR